MISMQPWWFSRLAGVKRWGIVAIQQNESVAEHSYQVAGIALWILDYFGLSHIVGRGELIEWALLHDMPEIYTGDLPTPMKRSISSILDGQNKRFVNQPDNDFILIIVKIADMAQAINWLHVNRKHTVHSQSVLSTLQNEYLEKIEQIKENHPAYADIWEKLKNLPDDLYEEKEW